MLRLFVAVLCGCIPGWQMSQLRVVKKYPNRRLYDTEISSYVTLEDLRQLIIEGETIEVRDARSGDDLTRSVLLQIIAEHEDIGQPIFSTLLLSQLIRLYGDSLQNVIGSYLEKSLQAFNEQQQQIRGNLGSLMGQTPWSLLNDITERNLDIWKGVQKGIISGLASSPPEKPKASAKPRNGRSRATTTQ
jgi:polyhydroxyalkanoate synthesis repressor PhaR